MLHMRFTNLAEYSSSSDSMNSKKVNTLRGYLSDEDFVFINRISPPDVAVAAWVSINSVAESALSCCKLATKYSMLSTYVSLSRGQSKRSTLGLDIHDLISL
jgi:hypothetical protein